MSPRDDKAATLVGSFRFLQKLLNSFETLLKDFSLHKAQDNCVAYLTLFEIYRWRGASLRKDPKRCPATMSAILSADDLNDFISPGVACIKPVESLPQKSKKDAEVSACGLRLAACGSSRNI